MVRTIYVVFTNIRLSDPQVRNMKQYKFLCPYDMVQVGDMIVVYFKNQEDAIKAVKILGESIKDLF